MKTDGDALRRRWLMRRTMPLREALKSVASDIRAAFVYGSVARAADKAGSDIDLMVVSDNLGYGDVFGAVDKLSRTLGRNINPTVYSAAEFSKRAKNENAFITRVIEGAFERLAGPGNVLAKEAPDAKEFEGLVRSGLARLKDAANAANSLESRFDLAYAVKWLASQR